MNASSAVAAAVNVNVLAALSAASPTIDCLIVKVLDIALSVPVVTILDLIAVVPLAAAQSRPTPHQRDRGHPGADQSHAGRTPRGSMSGRPGCRPAP